MMLLLGRTNTRLRACEWSFAVERAAENIVLQIMGRGLTERARGHGSADSALRVARREIAGEMVMERDALAHVANA